MSGKNFIFNIVSILTMFFVAVSIPAATGSVKISQPADMATVAAKKKVAIVYDADFGTSGDHLHVMVDNKRVGLVREMKGQTDVGPLNEGKHKICLVVNTKAHMPTGAEGCVTVNAK